MVLSTVDGVLVARVMGFLAFMSALFYLSSAITLFRLYLDLGGELWFRLSLGFTLLSLSQISMVFSITVGDARLSYALYTTTPALALSGIYMVWSSRRFTYLPALSPLVVLPSSLDMLAFLLAFTISRGFKGHARVGFTMVALAHLGRALGTLLLPGVIPVSILIVSEAVRALGALYMALGYARRVLLG